jgi:hypothetical protein
MSLEQKDLELIERIMYKNADDVAVAISRSFERLEGRIDAVESRIYTRMADLESAVDGIRLEIVDAMNDLKESLRDSMRFREDVEGD